MLDGGDVPAEPVLPQIQDRCLLGDEFFTFKKRLFIALIDEDMAWTWRHIGRVEKWRIGEVRNRAVILLDTDSQIKYRSGQFKNFLAPLLFS
jgi:hypothetical protein